MQKRESVEKLIAYFGGQVPTADKLNIGQGTVSGWLNLKHGISVLNAKRAEKLTKGEVKASDLCPSLLSFEYDSANSQVKKQKQTA